MVFDSIDTNHLASDLFDPESSMLYSETQVLTNTSNPNFSILTTANNSEGNIYHCSWAGAVSPMEDQGAALKLSCASISVANDRLLSEVQAKICLSIGQSSSSPKVLIVCITKG